MQDVFTALDRVFQIAPSTKIIFEKIQGLDLVEDLQKHENELIYKLCANLLTTHFILDDD